MKSQEREGTSCTSLWNLRWMGCVCSAVAVATCFCCRAVLSFCQQGEARLVWDHGPWHWESINCCKLGCSCYMDITQRRCRVCWTKGLPLGTVFTHYSFVHLMLGAYARDWHLPVCMVHTLPCPTSIHGEQQSHMVNHQNQIPRCVLCSSLSLASPFPNKTCYWLSLSQFTPLLQHMLLLLPCLGF